MTMANKLKAEDTILLSMVFTTFHNTLNERSSLCHVSDLLKCIILYERIVPSSTLYIVITHLLFHSVYIFPLASCFGIRTRLYKKNIFAKINFISLEVISD